MNTAIQKPRFADFHIKKREKSVSRKRQTFSVITDDTNGKNVRYRSTSFSCVSGLLLMYSQIPRLYTFKSSEVIVKILVANRMNVPVWIGYDST